MTERFKPDLLITQDGQQNHTFNEILGRFVDNNRPAAEAEDFIDVMYDEQLAGNFQSKLYDLVGKLTVGNGPNQDLDLFFTDEEEYQTFVSMIFERGTVVNPTRTPAGKNWGIVKPVTQTVSDVNIETLITRLVHLQPFENTTDGIKYFGLRATVRNALLPSGSPFALVKEVVNGVVMPETLRAALDAGNVPDKLAMEQAINTLTTSSEGFVFDSTEQFTLFYIGLTGNPTLPTKPVSTVSDLNPVDGTVYTYRIDHFISFGKPYYVVTAEVSILGADDGDLGLIGGGDMN